MKFAKKAVDSKYMPLYLLSAIGGLNSYYHDDLFPAIILGIMMISLGVMIYYEVKSK